MMNMNPLDEKLGIEPDDRYDGFSLVAYYKDQKYVMVPRTMVFGKESMGKMAV